MKLIILTKGMVSLIDDEDFDELNRYKWAATKDKHTFYAVRMPSRKFGKRKAILMHREIMQPSSDMDIDHLNGDGLDNRRSNLRICTTSENVRSQRLSVRNKSGYKGVYWDNSRQLWQGSIRVTGKHIFLGRFRNIKDAALAYNVKAKELFGEFALLNVIEPPKEKQ